MIRTKGILFSLACIISFLLVSCEDVISVKLKDASPQIVIEAAISNLTDTVRVMLHRSTDFFTPKNITAVTDATVRLTDNSSNQYFLTNQANGSYLLTGFNPVQGQSYTLSVAVEGEQYSGTAVMPMLVNIDSLAVDKRPDRPDENRVKIYFKDPPGIPNYYQIKVFKNDSLLNRNDQFSLYSDKYFDGRDIFIAINARRFGFPRFETRDTLKVQLISIDKIMFDYFQILHNITDEMNFLASSTPSNPPNNLNNNALGYFATMAISEKTFVVK